MKDTNVERNFRVATVSLALIANLNDPAASLDPPSFLPQAQPAINRRPSGS
jgi:hypothetical protein